MKNVLLPPSGKFNHNIHKLLIFIAVLLLNFQLAKADPNVEASIINVDNPDYCSAAEVTVGITPSWVPTTYDNFYIVSAKLFVQEVKSGGLSQDKLIASAGVQSPFQTSITFPSVYGLGNIKTEIKIFVENGDNPSESGTYTYTSEYGSAPYLLAVKAPKVLSFSLDVFGSSNPYELQNCQASSYDLLVSTWHTFGDIGAPTATFEIFEISSCFGSDGDNKLSMSFDESDQNDPFMDEFITQADAAFKTFVANNTGLYRVRFSIGEGYCGGPDSKEFCINISGIPSFEELYLIQNDEQPNTPLDTVPAPNSDLNAIFIGGFSGGLWAQLSSVDYDYFRFRLEYDNGSSYINVPLKSQYSTNNYNVGGTLNVQFNTMIFNPSDFLFQNLGNYRIFLTVGVDGCGEESTVGYFKVDSTWQYKNSEVTPRIKDKAGKEIAIYPTPAKDVLTIDYSASQTQAYYTLSDFNGKMLISGTLTDSKSTLNISSLPTGAYLIHINSNNGDLIHRQKIIKL